MPYRLVWHGRWYQVWQRRSAPVLLDHLPLGNTPQPAAVAPCPRLQALAARGRLAALPRPLNRIWALNLGEEQTIVVPSSGRHRIWVGGSTRGRLRVSVDGRSAGSVSRQLQNAASGCGSASSSSRPVRTACPSACPRPTLRRGWAVEAFRSGRFSCSRPRQRESPSRATPAAAAGERSTGRRRSDASERQPLLSFAPREAQRAIGV
jgi:hypothetical protein